VQPKDLCAGLLAALCGTSALSAQDDVQYQQMAPVQGGYAAPPTYPGEYYDEDWSSVEEPGFFGTSYNPWIGVEHRARGYGYERGYTAFESQVPLFEEVGSSLTSFQGNLLLDNAADFGGNAGLVHRRLIGAGNRSIGGSIFFDHREAYDQNFYQMGLGIESLGENIDFRANGYIPLGKDTSDPLAGTIRNPRYAGRNLWLDGLRAQALAGFDVEVGGRLPYIGDLVRSYIGLYHFQGNGSEDVTGVQGRFEARINHQVKLHLALTSDGTYGNMAVLGIGLYWPSIARDRADGQFTVADRFNEPVYRNQNIVVAKQEEYTTFAAEHPGGGIIDFVHVNSGALPGGNGSVETPFQSLADVAGNSSPRSVIFGHANSVFNGESIVLQSGQQLLGEGVEHIIGTKYGPVILPTATDPDLITSVPLIQGFAGDGVTLAGDNVVSGWTIRNGAGSGIVGTNVANIVIDEVVVEGNGGDGAALSPASGTIRVTDSRFDTNGGDGLRIQAAGSGTANTYIQQVAFLDNGGNGLQIDTFGTVRHDIVLLENSARIFLDPTEDTHPSQVQITSNDTSTVRLRMENNFIDDIGTDDGVNTSEDAYFHQVRLEAADASQMYAALIDNRLESNREFLNNSPANGPFGVTASSNGTSQMWLRMDTNTSMLNYAFQELDLSRFRIEDSLDSNTGTFFYFPSSVHFETIPVNSFVVP